MARNSNSPVSDDAIGSSAEDDPPVTQLKKTKLIKDLEMAGKVVKPKHRSAKHFRAKSATSISGVGAFLETRVGYEAKRFDLDKERFTVSQEMSQE